ncbi:MAG: YfdX family protein, partial [Anaerolineae bacterium]
TKAVSKAKEHLGKGARDEAVEVLKAADVGLVSEDLSMPLSDTMAHVDQTLKLIGGDKLYEANLELKKALDGLVRETTVLVQPTMAAAAQPAPTASGSDQAKAAN